MDTTNISSEQAVSNFFTPASQKEKVSEKLSWRTVNSSLIVGRYSTSSSGIPELVEEKKPRKVAAFDFDSTIIRTVSKAQFAKDANDWCWWHGSVPGKLKELDDEGYILVILSNQNGISLRNIAGGPKITKNDRFTQFKQKSVAVFNALNLPINIYAATERDKYRKPGTGMWEQFLIDQNLTAEDIDFEASIFVGDAGGRLAGVENGKIIKADFSCSDRLVKFQNWQSLESEKLTSGIETWPTTSVSGTKLQKNTFSLSHRAILCDHLTLQRF